MLKDLGITQLELAKQRKPLLKLKLREQGLSYERQYTEQRPVAKVSQSVKKKTKHQPIL